MIGGDNYMVEHEDEAIKAVGEAIARFQPGLVVAGPAFDAGRYGAGLCGRLRRGTVARHPGRDLHAP